MIGGDRKRKAEAPVCTCTVVSDEEWPAGHACAIHCPPNTVNSKRCVHHGCRLWHMGGTSRCALCLEINAAAAKKSRAKRRSAKNAPRFLTLTTTGAAVSAATSFMLDATAPHRAPAAPAPAPATPATTLVALAPPPSPPPPPPPPPLKTLSTPTAPEFNAGGRTFGHRAPATPATRAFMFATPVQAAPADHRFALDLLASAVPAPAHENHRRAPAARAPALVALAAGPPVDDDVMPALLTAMYTRLVLSLYLQDNHMRQGCLTPRTLECPVRRETK